MFEDSPEILNEWIEYVLDLLYLYNIIIMCIFTELCIYVMCIDYRVQSELKKRLVTGDDFTWKVRKGGDEEEESCEVLKYIGGVDLSFLKDDPSVACATLVVLDLKSLEIVYQDSCIVRLSVPYVPGFLAFREVCISLNFS